MRSVIFMGLSLLLFVVQGVFLSGRAIHVDIVSMLVAYLALERAVLPGAVFALVLGYLNDIFAGTSRGLYAATLVIVFFAIRLPIAGFAGARFVLITGVGVVATLLVVLVSTLVEHLVGPGGSSLRSVAPALPSLLVGALILSYPVDRLFRAVDERFKEPEDDFVFRD